MSSMPDEFRRKADELLARATAEPDLKKRSQLIDEAAYWHQKARVAGARAGAKR